MISDPAARMAVVTGGASGFGRALAVSCIGAGMRVVVADGDGAALAVVADALDVVGAQTDVTDPASMRR